MMAAGKKKKKKPPKRWTGKPASVWAIKGARVAKNLAWMPDEVVLHLAGDWRTKLLDVCGWGTTVGGAHDTWPRDHIEANRI